MLSTNKIIKGDNMAKTNRRAAILALAFGQGANGTPGKSNEALAAVVKKFHEENGFPMFLQWEIADCISKLIKADRDLVVRKHRAEDKYLDTYEVIAQAWEFAKRHDIKKVIVAAHPDHMKRCVMVAKKIGFIVEEADTLSVPYDEQSVQEWTRNKKFFTEQYEPKAMEYYRKLGYID